MKHHISLAMLCVCFLLLAAGLCGAAPPEGEETPRGWVFPTIGVGRGDWSASVGLFGWYDRLDVRNLQVRADVDLAPGVRAHAVVRSDRELNTLRGLSPRFDEAYVEAAGFHRSEQGNLSASLRLGEVRYLRFPYPDQIAVFDLPPGVGDLAGLGRTGYGGVLGVVDYRHRSGLGAHLSAIEWGFGHDGGLDTIESYVSYGKTAGSLDFEARFGRLQARPEPAGRSAPGYNLFAGLNWKGYEAGMLYEKLDGHPAYTGIMVRLTPTRITRAMGTVAFDYVRDPEGFAMQAPLARGRIGKFAREAPAGMELAGEIHAERIRTYWQNGHVRNYYEHRVSSWGQTGPGLTVVVEEEPWYLQAEALVSPHTNILDIEEWEKDRQGPAQNSQKVVYRFYSKR